ncbi:MAG TPA: ChbG/HpnK family deacetylase, partial [Gemmatimonadaceae bacterium]|nr:ChbG/HpnK family deacetylase [Gemmatimonadaceae bacterium]
SLGLHLDLGEWRFEDGGWLPNYERAPLGDAWLLEAEVTAQLERFVSIVGRKPTHLDSHQHAHHNEPLRSVVLAKAAQLGVPVRHFTPSIRYLGDFYGQDEVGNSYPERVSAEFLRAVVGTITEGITELCCHPALIVDFEGAYASERVAEMNALCTADVLSDVQDLGIELISFEAVATQPQA